MPIFKKCIKCRNTYQVHGGQMFCSLRCRKMYYRAEKKDCPVCGKSFQPKGNQIYCSKEHRQMSALLKKQTVTEGVEEVE